MTQATATVTATVTATEVERVSDWVIPVKNKVTGEIVYALQINKTQAEKDNFTEIYNAYVEKGVEVLTYNGKGEKPVYLVDATQRLKAQRVSATTEDMIAEMVALGVSEDVARLAIANAKAKKAQEKAEKAKS